MRFTPIFALAYAVTWEGCKETDGKQKNDKDQEANGGTDKNIRSSASAVASTGSDKSPDAHKK
jgi:hypothetical protein